MVATFKLKSLREEPSSKLQWGAMLSSYFEDKLYVTFTAQLRASRHVKCLCLPQRRLLEKEEY